MSVAKFTKSLNWDKINNSSEISAWLNQFDEADRDIAKHLLLRLNFVSKRDYSEWFTKTITKERFNDRSAIYVVRKVSEDQKTLWKEDGSVIDRPGQSQGSEDFVYSLVSDITREFKDYFYDHPSLECLKRNKIRNVIFVDDSIGSGGRVCDFIELLFANKTILSWWSLGLIKLHILSFARTKESECCVINKTPGSNHWRRKFKKNDKIVFFSEIVYSKSKLLTRWGEHWEDISQLCRRQRLIGKGCRLGYGEVMGNIIFYHSVPNNIPGVLFVDNKRWNSLLSRRAIPSWLISLLEKKYIYPIDYFKLSPPKEMLLFLSFVKRGIRKSWNIGLRMDIDSEIAMGMFDNAVKAGLITRKGYLTSVGLSVLKENQKNEVSIKYDYGLYIPEFWCAEQVTVQPSANGQAYVTKKGLVDGEAGEASLERSDAKTALPSLRVRSQNMSKSPMRPNSYGSEEPKER